MGGTMTSTTYIKGNKMRTDTVTGDTTRTTIFDIDTQKMYSFDSKKKEADVYDMQKLGADMSKSVQVGDMKASVKPNGKTKQIAGKTATGYDMEISVPATMGGARRHEDDREPDRPDVDREGRAGHGGIPRRSTRARSRRAGSSATRARAKGTARPGQGDGRDVPAARRRPAASRTSRK